ncbi:hypothetical protein C8R43DRAFT_1032643 [Mycena crocata]|nr:hypothetical protein C8R43DRAFT_1032643 [Mycena crocata]
MFSAGPLDGRMAAKTPGRENTFHRGPMTVQGKGKQNSVASLQPHTVQSHRISKDVKNPTRIVTRPLGDKTPFPNRDAPNKFNTPLPGEQKIAKLVLLDTHANKSKLLHPTDTPDSVARPSSTRKHVRVPRSAERVQNINKFETPVTNGNHWDVSELDIHVPAPVAEELPPVVDEEDYDEIEYMPPSAVELPYTPPFDFDLPNYATVGAGLLRLAQSYPYDDVSPIELEPAPEACLCDMPVFTLPDIQSDDPFLEVASKPRPTSTSKPVIAPTRTASTVPIRTAAPVPAASRTRLGPTTPTAASSSLRVLAGYGSGGTRKLAPAPRKPLVSADGTAKSATATKPATRLSGSGSRPGPGTTRRLPAPAAALTTVAAATRARATKTMVGSVRVAGKQQHRVPAAAAPDAIVSLVSADGDEMVGDEFVFDV